MFSMNRKGKLGKIMDKDKCYYNECKVCGVKNPEPSHFWRNHFLKEADYCYTYLPRYSQQTGELINFKSREFYFSADFNDKNELKRWIKENKDKALSYCL